LAAHPSANVKTFADFVAAARAAPGKLNYGSPGNGSPGHLSAEILKQLAKINIVHVPYRGAGPAILDLVAGQIPLGMVAIPGAIGHIRSGSPEPIWCRTQPARCRIVIRWEPRLLAEHCGTREGLAPPPKGAGPLACPEKSLASLERTAWAGVV
jgi:tripartite-type tricarboxylate transporter receptor subunit TctC